ncbi:MAG: hypothetical protein ACO3XO_07740 [Bdellovibrionota bacterium]
MRCPREETNTTDSQRVDISVANRIEQVLQSADLADSRRDAFVRKALAILRKDQYEEKMDGIKANAE